MGERLRQARLGAGLSLRRLAFPGCTAPYISAIEHGRRVPSLQILQALAERLQVGVEYLATGDDGDEQAALREAELALRLDERERAEHLFAELAGGEASGAVRARALAGLGELRFHAGDVAEAAETFERALAEAGGELAELPSAVDLLGRCLALRGDILAAIDLYRRAVRRAEERGDRIQAVRFSVLLANAYVDVGDVGGAVTAMAAMLDDVAELADPLLRARLDWTRSRLHTVEGRHDLAAEFAERALDTLRVADDEHAVARAQQMLSYIEIERGDPAAALARLDAARPAMTRLAGRVELAIFDLERARALTALARHEEARELALEVAPVLAENARGNGGRCFVVLGRIFHEAGDDRAALDVFDAAIDALAGHRSPHLMRAYQGKAAVLEGLGRRDEALDALKCALEARVPSR